MRRCGWCGVRLRWWQLVFCRVCGFSFRYDLPSPPCADGSRWDEEPDSFFRWEPPKFPEKAGSS